MASYELHHIHHETVDVDVTAAFYTDNFHGEITERFEKEGVQWARVKVGGTFIFITDRGTFDIDLGSHRGIDHFCLHTDDFEGAMASLRANNVNIVAEPWSSKPGSHACFISGPDNMKIEILSISK
jgi:predicted enzyme related to lactoylglutathione lyase